MKTLCIFEEMGLSSWADDGSVKHFITDKISYDKKKVVDYLSKGHVQAVCAKPAIDCVTREQISTGFKVLDDGEYVWCDFLIHHIEKYNISLPDDFIAKIDS